MKQDSFELIAEIAQAHDGSLGLAHSYIDALAGTGVHTVKFQMHIASAESSAHEQFRIAFSYEDATRYDYWKRMEFSQEQWEGLKRHTEEKGMRFLCSAFSIEAFERLEQLGVERHKVASGEVHNHLLLKHMCRTGKPLLVSSGMSSYSDITKTIDFIKNNNGNLDTLFQCTTAYPTPAEKTGLNVISEFRSRYDITVGLSDHSAEIWPHLGAYMLGARKFEFHVVFDHAMFGPDAGSSLNLKQIKELQRGMDFLQRSVQNPADKEDAAAFETLRRNFGKSLALRKTVKAGDPVREEDLETRKPAGYGIPPDEYETLLGKTYARDLNPTDFLQYSDIR